MTLPFPGIKNSLIALATIAPISVHADNGVLEINPACATGDGCFDGDDAGLPVEIRNSGSYRLTGNLITHDPNQTVIYIDVDRVTLDLGGFSIDGPNFCLSPDTDPCSDSGIGVGIRSTATSSHITIRNGHVTGMGNDGVRLRSGPGKVHDVTVEHSGEDGIQAGFAVNIHDNNARRNKVHGINLTSTGNIRNNTATKNGQAGIHAEDSGDFVKAVISDNLATENGSEGLVLDPSVGYRSNVMRLNNGGDTNPQVSGGLEIGPNVCATDTTCP